MGFPVGGPVGGEVGCIVGGPVGGEVGGPVDCPVGGEVGTPRGGLGSLHRVCTVLAAHANTSTNGSSQGTDGIG